MSDGLRRVARRWGARLFVVIALGTLAYSVYFRLFAKPPPLPPMSVGIQAIVLSDDDGGRATDVEPDEIQAAVDAANRIYAGANLRFEFDPSTHVTRIRDTALNSTSQQTLYHDMNLRRRINELAAESPDRITVLYRWGPNESPTSNGFSHARLNVVVMPIYKQHIRCDTMRSDGLAHELGHYLGLPHTFGHTRFKTVAEAEAAITNNGLGPRDFDGDRMDSTPPDPLIEELKCDPPPVLTLHGEDYELPRDNIMSYYYESRSTLTREQADRVRWGLAHRLRRGMIYGATGHASDALEIEHLPYSKTDTCTPPQLKETWSYFRDGWSDNAYLHALGSHDCTITLTFRVPESGPYAIELWAALTDDGGILETALDGQSIDRTFDLYAPVRVPSGPLVLGTHQLQAGEHKLELRARERNELSRGRFAGLDALGVTPAAP